MRARIFKQIVGEGDGRRLLDLGCGPGNFSRSARDLGWKVTAVDGRTTRLEGKDMSGIDFVQADVRDFDVSGFDTITNLGLLYHLPLDAQRDLLERSSYTRVILETQVHEHGVVPPSAEPWGWNTMTVRRTSSGYEPFPRPARLQHYSGRLGRIWQNHLYPRAAKRMPIYQGIVFKETLDRPSASIGNETSFWQTERSLLRMLERCGYRSVCKIEPPLYSIYGLRRYFVLNGA
jgi:SAM-dependent methyltransferase